MGEYKMAIPLAFKTMKTKCWGEFLVEEQEGSNEANGDGKCHNVKFQYDKGFHDLESH